MSLSSTSIERPVMTIVLSAVIVIFGVIGYYFLGVRDYPSVDPPIITVLSSYVGANADVVESKITEPLEESINGIAGVKSISSTSREGRSTITVEFDLGIDLDAAANDVRDRVSRVRARLPQDMDPPVVSKADANATPILYLAVQSERRGPLETTQIANDIFKERLQTIPGVSEVQIYGEKRFSMRLWMDPAKLAAYKLTPLDVQNAITRENVELPSGRIEGSTVELSVRTMGNLTEPEEFNKLVVAKKGDQVVRFEDIGEARVEAENQRSILRRNGEPMVIVVLIPQPGANNIAIADEFYQRLEQIKKELPPDITTAVNFDTTEYIRKAIDEVIETLLIAFGLVLLVIYIFLRDWRSTLIPIMAIPVSLIGAFFVMYVMGYSVNILTLLAIVLSIGLVVDDAIVVLENIYTKIEEGQPPIQAGHRGSKEIYFAVIATTIVLVAVFLPVVFLQGFIGRLFREFGVVVAGAVLISMFVALSLTPMMATRLLRKGKKSAFYRASEPFFDGMVSGYRNTLNAFMHQRAVAWVVMLVCAGAIVWLYVRIPSELAPQEDRSNMRLISTAPEGTGFEHMDRFMLEVTKMVMDSVPEGKAFITVTAPGFSASGGVNSGFVNIFLSDADERKRTQQEIAAKLTREVNKYTTARTFISQPQTISTDPRAGGLPVQYVLQAPDFESLKEYIPKFVDAARNDPAFAFVDLNLKFNKPELRVDIDRDKARNLNVSVLDIARTLQLALSESRYGFYVKGGQQYQIIGQLMAEKRADPMDLKSIFVRSQSGELIQLDNLVRVTEVSNPPQLYRYNRYASATVSASLAPGKTLGEGLAAMDRIKEATLPASFSRSLSGQSRDFAESSSSLGYAFLLALVMIYLVLAAQFESFMDPLIILFTVPLALAGALGCLWLFGQSLNIFSQIGIIMLIGLVTKNGILIVEFANHRKHNDGLSTHDAAVDAAASRLRPILMTSFSSALGFLPIALALGAGAESRVSMGIVVVGGVLFSTFLTLYIIPALYTFLSRSKAGTHIEHDAVVAAQDEKEIALAN